jgi:hypothetical protein
VADAIVRRDSTVFRSMKMNGAVRLVLVGVLGIGVFGAYSCSNPQNALPRPANAIATVPRAATLPDGSAQQNADTSVRTFSVASLQHDVLDECIDLTVRLDVAVGNVPEWQSKDASDLRQRLARLGTELPRPCAEEFASRPVLATCLATTKREGQELELLERYYNFTTVGMDDIYMQECLRLGGTWQALAKDSPEFRKAQQDATLRRLESMAAGYN